MASVKDAFGSTVFAVLIGWVVGLALAMALTAKRY